MTLGRKIAWQSGATVVGLLLVSAASLWGINGLTAELMEDHIRHHVVNPDAEPDAERARGATELIEVVRTYLK